MNIELSPVVLALTPLILGLVQALKVAKLPAEWSPVVAVVLGVALSLVLVNSGDWRADALTGLLLGLSSMGLWSGGKVAVETVVKQRSSEPKP